MVLVNNARKWIKMIPIVVRCGCVVRQEESRLGPLAEGQELKQGRNSPSKVCGLQKPTIVLATSLVPHIIAQCHLTKRRYRSMSPHDTLSLNVTSLDLVVVLIASRGCGGGTRCDPWSCWPSRSYDPSFGMEVRCSGRHGWLDAAYNLVSLVCFSFFFAGRPWRLLGEGGLGGSSPFSRSRGL